MVSSTVSAEELAFGAPALMMPSLEDLLTEDFGLETATPLQRAMCRIADGRALGDLKKHPHVLAAIGQLGGPKFVPSTMALMSAIRGAKSMLAGAAAIRLALTCDVTSDMREGEMPRVAIVALTRDTARPVYQHICGALARSDRLRARVVGEPRADRVALRHPSGKEVEIVISAGAKAGGSLTARWMAGVIFDEAPRMQGQADGVINLDSSRDAVAGRLLPGGCSTEWLVGSPWAPFGPCYKICQEHWLHPNPSYVVVRGRGDWLNPAWWTQERAEELRVENENAYRTDFLAEFADAEDSLLATHDIEACTRAYADRMHAEGATPYAAEMDPGTRANAWTLLVGKRHKGVLVVVLAKEWRGTKSNPLSPKRVFTEMAHELAPYACTDVGTDQWSVDANRDIAREVGLRLLEQPGNSRENAEGYLELKTGFSERRLELPNEPYLLADLRRLKRVTTQTGIRVDLPKTGDGRHCDYAPALMRLYRRHIEEREEPDTRSAAQREQDDIFRQVKDKWGRKKSVPWWKRGIG